METHTSNKQTEKPGTLFNILSTQDGGEKSAERICEKVLNDKFDAKRDPISAIIVNAFVDNDYTHYDMMETDIDYAINQLKKAKAAIRLAQEL